MATSFINTPVLSGLVAPFVGDVQDLTKIEVLSTLVSVQIGFLDNGGPTGASSPLTVHFGSAVGGVPGVDFLAFVLEEPSQGEFFGGLSLPLAAGDTLSFRVITDLGNSSNFYAVLGIDARDSTPVGVRYTTLAQVKDAIGGTVDAQHDDNINLVIEEVSRAFDAYVGQSFVGTGQVEFHDGWSFRNGIALDRMPSEDAATRALASVVENGVTLVQDDDWFFEPFPSRLIYRTNGTALSFQGARFRAGERNIQVTYETAFKVLPAEIRLACRDESVHRWQGFNWTGATGGRIGLNSFTPGDGTVFDFTVDDFSPMTLRILQPYREGRYVG